MFGLGLSTFLNIANLGIKVAELAGGSGPTKKAAALEAIVSNPIMRIRRNPELERFLEDELLPVMVKLAHLLGSFQRSSGEVDK